MTVLNKTSTSAGGRRGLELAALHRFSQYLALAISEAGLTQVDAADRLYETGLTDFLKVAGLG